MHCSLFRGLIIVMGVLAASSAVAAPITIHFPATTWGQDTSQISGTLLGPPFESNERLAVSFIDVGQGDCTLLRAYELDEDGRELMQAAILVDCGTSSPGRPAIGAGAQVHIRDAFGDSPRRIDTLVVTHSDADHYNLLPFVLDGFDVGRVLYVGEVWEHDASALRSDGSSGAGAFADWLEARAAQCVRVAPEQQDAQYGEFLWFDSGDYAPLNIHLLAAAVTGGAAQNAKNTMSISLMVSYGLFDLVLTGDASGTTDQFIVDTHRPPDWPPRFLDCDVYKMAHHGAYTHGSTSFDWVCQTRPEVAVVSAQLAHKYGHPHREPTDRLEASTISAPPHAYRWWHGMNQPNVDRVDYDKAIFFTGTNGTIELETDGTRYTITCDSNIAWN